VSSGPWGAAGGGPRSNGISALPERNVPSRRPLRRVSRGVAMVGDVTPSRSTSELVWGPVAQRRGKFDQGRPQRGNSRTVRRASLASATHGKPAKAVRPMGPSSMAPVARCGAVLPAGWRVLGPGSHLHVGSIYQSVRKRVGAPLAKAMTQLFQTRKTHAPNKTPVHLDKRTARI